MDATPHHPDFWDTRYAAGRTPWDLGRVPARLDSYLAVQPAGVRVLIPGGGSSRELAAFVQAGHDALALDFAPTAVAQARARLGPALAGRVQLGDFFTAELAGAPFDVIYERTFFCALPPELRPAYVRRMRQLLKPTGRLIGFFYLGDDTDGPPFALSAADEASLFGGRFAVIVDEPSPDALPMFVGKERWRELKPLPGDR